MTSSPIVYLDEGLVIVGSGFQPFEPVQVFFDLGGANTANLGFADSNQGGAWVLNIADVGAVSRVGRIRDGLLGASAVSVRAKGADGSAASAPVMVQESAPEPVFLPHPQLPSPATSLVVGCAEPGSTVTLTGAGYDPNTSISVLVITGSASGGAPIRASLGSARANDTGAFTTDAMISLDVGLYTVEALGTDKNFATAPLQVLGSCK